AISQICASAGLASVELLERIRELSYLGVCTLEVPFSLILVRGGPTDALRVLNRIQTIEQLLFHKLRDLIDKHGPQLNLRGLVKQLEPELPFPFQLRVGLLRSLVEGWVQAGWTTLKPVNRETVRLGGLDAVELPLGRRQQ